MKKKIIFLVLDITLKGGVERFVSNMTNLFSEDGYGVKIISFHRTNKKPLYDFPGGVEIEYFSNFVFKSFFYKLIALVCCIRISFDLLFSKDCCTYISTSPIISILIGLFGCGRVSRVIASEHSAYNSHGNFIKKLRSLAYQNIDSVITQTQDGVNLFNAVNVKAVKIQNSVTDFKSDFQWRYFDKINIECHSPFVCLAIGRFEPVKQFDHYIEVAKIINSTRSDIVFQLVGDGPLKDDLQALVDSHGLSNVFKIYPATNNIDNFYKNASVFVITSETEAFPMVMIEAMSFGLPVLAYDKLVGPMEVIVDAYNGYLCDQNSPSRIAEAINLINVNSVKYIEMRNNSVATVRSYRGGNIIKLWKSCL